MWNWNTHTYSNLWHETHFLLWIEINKITLKGTGIVVRSMDPGTWWPEQRIQFCNLLIVSLWVNYLISFCSNSLICNEAKYSIYLCDYFEDKLVYVYKLYREVPTSECIFNQLFFFLWGFFQYIFLLLTLPYLPCFTAAYLNCLAFFECAIKFSTS